MQSQNQPEAKAPPFELKFIEPYSTFRADGTPTPIPFLVDGLLTEGGFSVLGAKPKVGKSSIARYLAVAVAKGTPFLDRETTQGEVILCTLEDPLAHVDNCLQALGHDKEKDAEIHLLTKIPADHAESVKLLRRALIANPAIRLVIIDHLAEFLNVPDLSDYVPVKRGVTLLRELVRELSHVHFIVLTHAKKVATSDPFDSYLGSTAIRGVPDTTIALLEDRGNRVIVTQTRAGRAIPATILLTDMVTRNGCDVVQGYSLGEESNQSNAERNEKADEDKSAVYANRVIDYLTSREDHSALQSEVLSAVTGKRDRVLSAIHTLEQDSILGSNGTPKKLLLIVDENTLRLYQAGRKEESYVN